MRLDCYDENESEHLDKLIHSENYILVDKDYYNGIHSKINDIENKLREIEDIVLDIYGQTGVKLLDEYDKTGTILIEKLCSDILVKIKNFTTHKRSGV